MQQEVSEEMANMVSVERTGQDYMMRERFLNLCNYTSKTFCGVSERPWMTRF